MDKIKKRLGRRPGSSDTKDKILGAAQALFARDGFEHTTIRAIAEEIDVDPALIAHYFGNKQELFIAAMAPSQKIPHKIATELAGDPETLGFRLATLFVSLLESKATNHVVVAALRAAVRMPGALSLMKAVIVHPILKVFKDSGLDEPELRATLVQSQLVGVIMARYILKVEPMASIPSDDLITYLTPTLQRYLTGDLHNKKEGI